MNKTLFTILAIAFCFLLNTHLAIGQFSIPADRNIFLNSEVGNDLASGAKESPLKSLSEAAKRVNLANGKGAITIYLAEGIYGLPETVTFHPANWHFSKEGRLTIRAISLPDDSDWNPGRIR